MTHFRWFFMILLVVHTILSQQTGAQQTETAQPGLLSLPSWVEPRALKFVEMYHPSRLESLKHMKTAQPEEYSRIMLGFWRRTEEINMLQKEDPERHAMEIRQENLDEKTFLLTQTYQAAKDDKEKQNVKSQLEATVNEQFELREQIREIEVKKMEVELQRIREKLKWRKLNKSEIVKQRVRELLNAGTGLEWE